MKRDPKDVLTIALPKGRILKEAAKLFRAAGLDFSKLMRPRTSSTGPRTWG
jgi:ATP phosphoribosyltransferase